MSIPPVQSLGLGNVLGVHPAAPRLAVRPVNLVGAAALVEPTSMSEADAGILRSLRMRLGLSATGSKLLSFADRARALIRLGARGELSTAGGRAAGMYMNGRVVVVDRDLAESGEGVLTLAHELQHLQDELTGRGTRSLRNEARANRTEAAVAKELGMEPPARAIADDGSVASEEAIMERLESSDFYRHYPTEPTDAVRPAGVSAVPTPTAAPHPRTVARDTYDTRAAGSEHPLRGLQRW